MPTELDPSNPDPPARPVHGGIKEAELRALGLRLEDCLDFSASVSPLGPPDGVAEAIAAVDLTAYPDPHCLALTEAIADHHAGEGVATGNVIVGNGSTEIIHLLTRAWIGSPPAGCTPGALLLTPTYGEYDGAVRISGGAVTTLTATRCSEGFTWDTSAVTAAIAAERPALTFVCNPNNPTGVLMGRDQLAEIADAVANTGGLLVVDEAYINLSERRADADVIELAARHGSVIALRSMTKDYALTALRLGYAVASEGVINRLAALQPDWSVNGLAQAAGLIAIADTAYLARARLAVVRLPGLRGGAAVRPGHPLLSHRRQLRAGAGGRRRRLARPSGPARPVRSGLHVLRPVRLHPHRPATRGRLHTTGRRHGRHLEPEPADKLKSHRRSCESRNPEKPRRLGTLVVSYDHWIPAFAGMTMFVNRPQSPQP